MLIKPKEILFGQPALKIRKVVQDAMNDSLWGNSQAEITSKVAKTLKQPNSLAKKIIENLIQEDYLILEKEKFNRQFIYKITETEKGRSFGLANANSPISRQKAIQLLDDLIKRAETINSNNELVYFVESISVFGSFLSEKESLGDLDVGIKLAKKYESDEFLKFNQHRIKIAKAKGRKFKSFVDELIWPYREVILMLKNRQRSLSLHNIEDDAVFNVTESKIVYQYNNNKPNPKV